jgi:DNA-binding PadR family transcriptional regulator
MQEVDRRTSSGIKLGPGTLYTSIKRMISDGLIQESDERPDTEVDDRRRRYYRLTDFGQRVLGAEVERLEKVVKEARRSGVPASSPTTLPEGT